MIKIQARNSTKYTVSELTNFATAASMISSKANADGTYKVTHVLGIYGNHTDSQRYRVNNSGNYDHLAGRWGFSNQITGGNVDYNICFVEENMSLSDWQNLRAPELTCSWNYYHWESFLTTHYGGSITDHMITLSLEPGTDHYKRGSNSGGNLSAQWRFD